MKRKYYLRGVGAGILFATIVLLTAYWISGAGRISDAEVIERAEELGMVQAESDLDQLQRPAETESAEETEEADTTEADTTEADTTEADSTGNAADDTETAATTAEPARIVTFTVVSGMDSWNVATLLQDQGVIDDASEFDAYLEAGGYSSRIATGEYSVEVGADYEAIAGMITGRNE